jgi:putative ABC transport system permease protein
MFGNYLTTALRHLLRHKLHTVINVGGLALGFAAFFAIMAITRFDLSYDQFLPGHEQIQRIEISYYNENGTDIHASAGPVSAKPVFLQEFPELIDAASQFYIRSDVEIRSGEDVFLDDILTADADFFRVFELHFIEGDPETAFSNGNSMVLTESMARKYFGETSPVGQNLAEHVVTGVIMDPPQNSHLSLGLMVHDDFQSKSWWAEYSDRWDINFMYTYIKFHDETDLDAVRSRFEFLIEKHLGPAAQSLSMEANQWASLRMVALADIHFEKTTLGALKPHSTRAANHAFFAIAILILAIAVINFVNLSTARATRRAKEISLRKVMGAGRKQLVSQLMGEAILMTTMAAIIGIAILEASTPWLQKLLELPVDPALLARPQQLLQFALLIGFVGIAAGAYPAFVLSAFKPSRHLGGGRSEGASTIKARSVLVIAQFSVSIALIISTVIVYQQTSFARSINLGFDKTGVITLSRMNRDTVAPFLDALKTELIRHPDTIAVASSHNVPGDDSEGNVSVRRQNDETAAPTQLSWQNVGYDYYASLSIEPVMGRLFDEQYPSDELTVREDSQGRESGAALLNMSAVQLLGFADASEAIGKRLILGEVTELWVIGVIPDIRYRSVRQAVRPSIQLLDLSPLSSLIIKFSAEDPSAYIRDLTRIWREIIPGALMQSEFLDQKIDAMYGSEERWANVFLVFSVLAILISSLGLFGLAAFAIERRIREMGIRKVFGARVGQIVGLFSWQFTKPVIVANLVAWPLAWYFMNDWLDSYAYRIDLNLSPFLTASAMALLIAWITVATQAYGVARHKPVYALKYE